MLVMTRPVTTPRPHQNRPVDGLEAVAVGLGTVQLLLDMGRRKDAKDTLRIIRNELQTLRLAHLTHQSR